MLLDLHRTQQGHCFSGQPRCNQQPTTLVLTCHLWRPHRHIHSGTGGRPIPSHHLGRTSLERRSPTTGGSLQPLVAHPNGSSTGSRPPTLLSRRMYPHSDRHLVPTPTTALPKATPPRSHRLNSVGGVPATVAATMLFGHLRDAHTKRRHAANMQRMGIEPL